jgi:hypothetical protein
VPVDIELYFLRLASMNSLAPPPNAEMDGPMVLPAKRLTWRGVLTSAKTTNRITEPSCSPPPKLQRVMLNKVDCRFVKERHRIAYAAHRRTIPLTVPPFSEGHGASGAITFDGPKSVKSNLTKQRRRPKPTTCCGTVGNRGAPARLMPTRKRGRIRSDRSPKPSRRIAQFNKSNHSDSNLKDSHC